jgi:hypothetical protein
MSGLAIALAALLRLHARTCVVLACLAAMLSVASVASAQPSVQTKTRVWAFESAPALNTWLQASATARTHPAFSPTQAEPALGSPLAARALPGTGQLLANASKVFRSGPLTVAGRALTKHPNIIGESGNILQKLGGAANVNAAAARALESIVQTGTMTTKSTKAFGEIIQYTLDSGLGARFSATSGEFIGFIGRGL